MKYHVQVDRNPPKLQTFLPGGPSFFCTLKARLNVDFEPLLLIDWVAGNIKVHLPGNDMHISMGQCGYTEVRSRLASYASSTFCLTTDKAVGEPAFVLVPLSSFAMCFTNVYRTRSPFSVY